MDLRNGALSKFTRGTFATVYIALSPGGDGRASSGTGEDGRANSLLQEKEELI